MDTIEIISIKNPENFESLKDTQFLRNEIFTKELEYPYDYDDLEEKSHHFIMYKNKKPVGTGRLTEFEDYIFLTRIGILKEERGVGLGKRILQWILDYCKQLKPKWVLLHTNPSNIQFYKNFGFEVTKEARLVEYYIAVDMELNLEDGD